MKRNRWSRAVPFVLLAAVAVPALAGGSNARRASLLPSPSAPLTSVSRREPMTRVDAAEVIRAMNRRRAEYGLSPLRENRLLDQAAADRAGDMAARHYFDHVAPDGTKPWKWVDARGYRYRAAGENLATGFVDADEVVDAWMKSPGHRANILSADYAEVGLAIHEGSPVDGMDGETVVALYGAR